MVTLTNSVQGSRPSSEHTRTSCVRLVFIVAAVIVAVAQPPQRDAAVVLALEAVSWAGVLVCGEENRKWMLKPLFLREVSISSCTKVRNFRTKQH